MEQILDTIGDFIQGILDNPTVQLGGQLIAIYVVMLWLATALWAYKDMSRRTANPILPYLAAAFIVVFTPVFFIFAAIVYKIVRPGETIAEANERSLAEEAMLVEVEAQAHCANCHRRVEHDWIICPSCRNRLRRVCPSCSKLVELDWSLCAWCGKDFERPELLRDSTTTRIPARSRTIAAATVDDATTVTPPVETKRRTASSR
jgi:RNA polymerase subunit RPABC4/transcription elongation factor Spt4